MNSNLQFVCDGKNPILDLPKLGYSIAEVSVLIGLSKGFLRNEIKKGRLKKSCFGRRVLISAENLTKYIKENEEK